jgi:hypothetical protein
LFFHRNRTITLRRVDKTRKNMEQRRVDKTRKNTEHHNRQHGIKWRGAETCGQHKRQHGVKWRGNERCGQHKRQHGVKIKRNRKMSSVWLLVVGGGEGIIRTIFL